jgi:hypothetical protein
MDEIINGKQKLNRIIKEILWEVPENPFEFPYTIYFKESSTSSKFKFTVEKIEEAYFIDDKGQKWMKVLNDISNFKPDIEY